MRCGTSTCITHTDFFAVLSNVIHELLCADRWEVLARDQHHGTDGGQANWFKVFYGIVGKVLDHQRIGGMTDMNHEQVIAIGCRPSDLRCTNASSRPSNVFDNNLLPQRFLHG